MAFETALKVTVRRLADEDRPLLEHMYAHFEPLGAALGLPPIDKERRKNWLADLSPGLSFGAFVEGALAGHLVLLPTGDRAEMVCFVHQDFRRRGIAFALGRAAVGEASAAGIRTIWVLIDNMNFPARRSLSRFGFNPTWEDQREAEFVYEVPEGRNP